MESSLFHELPPRQFLLIYSKRSKEDQRRDRDPEQHAARERELKDRERLEKQKERREKLAKEKAKSKEKAREAAAIERKKRREAAIKSGAPPPPDSEPEEDEKAESTDEDEEEVTRATAAQGVVFGDDSTVPSKRRGGGGAGAGGEDAGDSDAGDDDAAADDDAADAEEGGDDVVQISLRKFRLDPDGNLGLTIIVPLHSGAADSSAIACDDAGQPLSTGTGSASASSLALLGGGSREAVDEKRIELRAESKKIAGLWLVELRRLQYQIYCVTQYANILSRNKVYTMQGRFDLIQDPKPFMPVHLAASMAAGAAATESNAAAAAASKPSALSLFTSALTGDDRRCCAKCKSAFGLLRKTIVCIDCKNRFCNRPSCVMPLLHNTEEDTFSVATLAADHSLSGNGGAASVAASEKARRARKKAQADKKGSGLDASGAQRICNDCELIRAHDPLYQRLLHGQLNLCLKAVSGQGLMQCDLVGASDPYIQFHFAGRSTAVALYRQLNPVWDDSARVQSEWHDPLDHGGEKDVQAIFDVGQDAPWLVRVQRKLAVRPCLPRSANAVRRSVGRECRPDRRHLHGLRVHSGGGFGEEYPVRRPLSLAQQTRCSGAHHSGGTQRSRSRSLRWRGRTERRRRRIARRRWCAAQCRLRRRCGRLLEEATDRLDSPANHAGDLWLHCGDAEDPTEPRGAGPQT